MKARPARRKRGRAAEDWDRESEWMPSPGMLSGVQRGAILVEALRYRAASDRSLFTPVLRAGQTP